MSEPGFDVLEHTADAGIIARGRTLAEAFEQTALGMYSLMVDLGGVRETESREISAEGDTLESMLLHWLLELLFATDANGLLFRRFEVRVSGSNVTSQAFGERLDPERHDLGAAIKGVTRHLLEVAPDDGGFRTRVLFDI